MQEQEPHAAATRHAGGSTPALPAELLRHLRECEDCAQRSQQHLRVRRQLRALPRPSAPIDLTWKLRSLAARELAVTRRSAGASALRLWWQRHRLVLRDVMRPLAVPFAGGVCSAVMLFSMLVPNITFSLARANSSPDVPTGLSTPVSVKSVAPLGFGAGEAVVDLTVDDQGRIVDYSIVSEDGAQKDALRRGIENTLLFTTFNPATSFGQPMSGRIRLTFRNSWIDVRG
jgi:hypothetical protein